MARPASGSFLTVTLADGTRKFRLRFRAYGRREELVLHERPGCDCGCGGGWDEPAARTELGNVLARIWQRPEPAGPRASWSRATPRFGEYAAAWLQGKLDGTIGDHQIAANTEGGYRWILGCHLLPFFGRYPLDQIDRELCLAFKAQKVREAAELRELIATGADIRDRRNRRQVPLSPSSLRN